MTDARPAAAAPGEASGIAAVREVLRIRAFRRLWAVLGLSSLGDWLGLLATSTFASQQFSGSAAKGAAFGGVIAVRMLPALVLGPVAGVIADRWDRRYTMVVCDLGRFLLFASIPGVTLITSDPGYIVAWAAVATFIVESLQMVWAPAKESSVPNLLPHNRLEAANQLTLATTYGFAPISAVGVIAFLTWFVRSVSPTTTATSTGSPTHIALYFNALTFLASALTVYFGIHEISGRAVERPAKKPSLLREFITGWSYVAKTPLVRGLVLGILGAFAGAGVVVGTAQFYAVSLGGGVLSFYILFGSIFVGLSVGIVAGPVIVGALSRRRWFGLSIVFAAVSVTILAFAWHLLIGVLGALCVGVGAGMAFLSGITLLGTEVGDDVRGRVFAFIQTGTQVTLLLTISLSSFIVGLGGTRHLFGFTVSTTRPMLLAAGVFGFFAGVAALKQMDDKPGIPIFADLIGSMRGRPLGVPSTEENGPELVDGGHPLPGYGKFIVFEGGEGAGKSTQVRRLVDTLEAYGRSVIDTREPGATPIGRRIRQLVLHHDGEDETLAPRAEALLYAADRAHHVATVIRPALQRGTIVISDRYIDSSLAYQGAGRTLPPEEVKWLSRWATAGLRPDLVILLDIDPAVGLRRAEERSGKDRLEAESLAFHQRVRDAFLGLAAADPERYLVINASDPVEVIAFAVRERVHALLPPSNLPSLDGTAAPTVPTDAPSDGAVHRGVASVNTANHAHPDSGREWNGGATRAFGGSVPGLDEAPGGQTEPDAGPTASDAAADSGART